MKNLHTFRLWANTWIRPCVLCLSLITYLSSLISGNSQNIAINATGNQADPSAMLDVSSQTAGVLIPRMSTSARNAISSPAVGLQIFNTDCNELNYWNGTCWLSLGSLPTPGAITSGTSTALCAAVTTTYSITAVTGATGYVWMVPAGATINSGQGTTSISVTYGNYSGQICVNAYDACESSEQRCMDVNISPIPPTPGNITGLASVYPGQTAVTYFIASVSGASGYNWTVPSGASIITGVGTPAITVSFACNAVSGNVSVTAGSNCGTSSPSSQAVTIMPYLAANAGSAVFGGAAIGGSPTATAGFAPYTYSWSPNSNLSGSTVANPTALCSGSTTTYSVTITDANGCTSTSSAVVTRNLSASAGSAVFGGAALSGSATGGQSPYAYSWSPNSNLSSYTVSNPTTLCSGSTTTYTLTVTDANGCTATSSVVVTRNLSANAGSAILGGAALSGSATGGVSPYAYSWSPASNLSGYSVSNPTAFCSGSTTTYTLTAMDANGCTATSGVVVTRNLSASAGSNMSICTSGSTSIGPATATGGNSSLYSYSWSPSTGLSNPAIASPTANPVSTSNYTVTVTDANGCTATSSMTLTVSSGTHGSQTFTANGSGSSGSIQTFTVPPCISSVTIFASGAQGGTSQSGYAGGLGASMQGTFSLSSGTAVSILVGQAGTNAPSNLYYGGGGGGGSFVVANGNLLIAAGGGGGASGRSTGPAGGNGTTSNNGNSAVQSPSNPACAAPGGSGGAGGQSGDYCGACGGCNGSGGGGYSGNGVGSTNGGGTAYLNGGTGGVASQNGGYGGGGASGGSFGYHGGGGGGYSGGGGGENTGSASYGQGGGGGGSYILSSATNQSGSSGVQSGNGQVVITY